MDRRLASRIQNMLLSSNGTSITGTARDNMDEPINGNTGATNNNNTSDDETNKEKKSIEDYYGFNPIEAQKQLMENLEKNNAGDLDKQNTKIFGLPHQFLETADFRVDSNNNFGYCFAKEIYLERPMVTLIPGKPNYLPDYSAADKEMFQKLLNDDDYENSKSLLGKLIEGNEESRYYDFVSDYKSYIKYVNLMCRAAAIFLDIGGEIGPDGKTPYNLYNWANYQSFSDYKYTSGGIDDDIFDLDTAINDRQQNNRETLYNDLVVGEKTFVNFIVDPSSSVTENIGNVTQKSQLEGAFDSMEGIVKEATMFMNSMSEDLGTFQSYITKAGEKILELGNTISGGLFKKMLGLAEEQVLHGSNLIYPEIWMDSEYSKTYQLKMKLVSPYGDREAIYLNIFVPMFHALCLALPKQTSANSFTSPFLLRGYSTGWFSIDMGMVESIDIDKGPEQSWSAEGFPTEVDVTLTIKDFYSQLMMCDSSSVRMFWTNQGLIDFLGVTCGLDLSKPNVVIKLDVMKMLATGIATDIIPNIYLKLTEGIKNKLHAFFGNAFL